MNEKSISIASLPLGKGSYESPEVTVVEIHSEGVLCASGQFEEWEEETLSW